MDMQRFNENRRRFPPEELARHAGQYVAWNTDGTAILDSDEDLARLDERLQTASYNLAELVVSTVPADDLILGGGLVD
jgi:hypothetical protein